MQSSERKLTVITCAKGDLPGEYGADGVGRVASVARVVDLGAEVLRQERREVERAVAQQLPTTQEIKRKMYYYMYVYIYIRQSSL